MMQPTGAGFLGVVCHTCLHAYRNGIRRSDERGLDAMAAYRWTGPNGAVTYLCVSCCASWRMNAKADPSLTPRRIETVPETPVTDVRWQ